MMYPKIKTVMSENTITEKTKARVENPCPYLSLQVVGLIPVKTCQYPHDADIVMCNRILLEGTCSPAADAAQIQLILEEKLMYR
jgi:hypothetical protein